MIQIPPDDEMPRSLNAWITAGTLHGQAQCPQSTQGHEWAMTFPMTEPSDGDHVLPSVELFRAQEMALMCAHCTAWLQLPANGTEDDG